MALTSYTGTSGNLINLNVPQNSTTPNFTVNTTIPAGAYQLTIPSGVVSVTIGSKTFTSSGLVNIPTAVTSASGEVSYLPIIWSTREPGWAGQTGQAIAYGNGVFVAVGNSGRLSTSTDGLTWTTRNANMGTTKINCIAYGDGAFIAGGQRFDSTTARLGISTDGITWTTRGITFPSAGPDALAATFGNGLFLVCGFRTDTGAGNWLARSADKGVTWTSRLDGWGLTSSSSVFTIAFGNNNFVAAGQGGMMASSADGYNWTTRTSGFGATNINSVGFGNGLFVAGGSNGTLTTSPDGITWTARTSNLGTARIDKIGYANGYYFALTNGAAQMTVSTNGTTWFLSTLGSAAGADGASMKDITYGKGRYVSVPTDYSIFYASSYTIPSDLTVQLEYKGVGSTAV